LREIGKDRGKQTKREREREREREKVALSDFTPHLLKVLLSGARPLTSDE
jgi:hypothetical protein